VEVMVFTDFPTETYGEALETLRWLKELQGDIALFMCGRFELSPGAAVADQPEDFGIREIWTVAGDDLCSKLYYRESVHSKTARERQRIDNYLTGLSRHWRLSHYPWAGSLSTAHTLLWYDRFGPGVFKDQTLVKTRKTNRISDPRPLPISRRFARLAENALHRENEIWERLVYRERVVSPERYGELAEALPVFTMGKTSGNLGRRRSPRQLRRRNRQLSRIC
jgi:anaerobic magnesium-protoporphyrin IX monomethyl ester cyclase